MLQHLKRYRKGNEKRGDGSSHHEGFCRKNLFPVVTQKTTVFMMKTVVFLTFRGENLPSKPA